MRLSIGNGTANRETEFFIKKMALDDTPPRVFVSERGRGISIFSIKDREDEFPKYDVTVGRRYPIGRRLSDPPSIVKIVKP